MNILDRLPLCFNAASNRCLFHAGPLSFSILIVTFERKKQIYVNVQQDIKVRPGSACMTTR